VPIVGIVGLGWSPLRRTHADASVHVPDYLPRRVGVLHDLELVAIRVAHPELVGLARSLGDLGVGGQYIRSLTERQVDGLLFVAGGTPLTRELVGPDVHVVAICRPTDETFGDCTEVNNDMRKIIYDGISHLARKGCVRIAFLAVFTGAPARFARWLEPSYRAALEDAGLRLDRNLELVGPHEEPSYLEAELLVGECLDGGWAPDGIFAYGDRLALGAMNTLVARGLIPGRDVRVLGLDDSALARMSSPTLSSIARDPECLAKNSVEALLSLMEGGQPPSFPFKIILHSNKE